MKGDIRKTHRVHGKMRNVSRIQINCHEGKSSLRRPKRKWEDKREWFLQEIGSDVWDYIQLTVM